MRRLLMLLALLTVAPSLSHGAAYDAFESRARRYGLGTQLSAVALNAAAATRTMTVDLDNEYLGYDLMVVYIDHTNSSGALTVTMDCTNAPTASDTDATLQDCDVASGVCTSSDATWEKAVTGSKAWPWRVDISGLPGQIDCVFAAAGAGASDLATVKAWLVTK